MLAESEWSLNEWGKRHKVSFALHTERKCINRKNSHVVFVAIEVDLVAMVDLVVIVVLVELVVVPAPSQLPHAGWHPLATEQYSEPTPQ